jgi:hydrogenase maturation protease
MTTYTEQYVHEHQHTSAPAVVHHASPILVIGYGNALRGDDAAGQVTAERVAAWKMPGIETIAVHQLTPELAERLANAACAIFVDASVGPQNARASAAHVLVRTIGPGASSVMPGHTADPRDLLALAGAVYGHVPRAWCIHVPATQFEFGADLSPEAEKGVDVALRAIRAIVTSAGPHAQN